MPVVVCIRRISSAAARNEWKTAERSGNRGHEGVREEGKVGKVSSNKQRDEEKG